METFKETAKKLFDREPSGAYLNNLGERKEVIYSDNSIPEEIDELFKEIAGHFKKEAENLSFDPETFEGTHYFWFLPKELKDMAGNIQIGVCPYKGEYYGPFVESNYMWSKNDDYADLFIDIYDTENHNAEWIYNRIVQELYNFLRDANWVLEGVYEDEMEKMKEEIEKEAEKILEEN